LVSNSSITASALATRRAFNSGSVGDIAFSCKVVWPSVYFASAKKVKCTRS
jgi:hypothetical protein